MQMNSSRPRVLAPRPQQQTSTMSLLEQVRRAWNPLWSTVLLILFIWGIKEAVTRLAFSCPCYISDSAARAVASVDGRMAYGALFIGVPALMFWLIGIICQDSTWRCVSGCCSAPKCRFPGRSCLCVWSTLGKTLVAPITWLFLVYLEGSYLECTVATVPTPCLDLVTDDSRRQQYVDENLRTRVISQIVAWGTVGGATVIGLSAVCLYRCCSSMTYHQRQHARAVRQLGEAALTAATRDYYSEDLRAGWRLLMEHGDQADWADVSEHDPDGPVWMDKHLVLTELSRWQYGGGDHAKPPLPSAAGDLYATPSQPPPLPSARPGPLPPIQQQQGAYSNPLYPPTTHTSGEYAMSTMNSNHLNDSKKKKKKKVKKNKVHQSD